MTLERAPLTFAGAMATVAVRIGHDVAAHIADRSERTIYGWSHPTTKTTPTIAQALAFDAAYREAGGTDSPFLDAYAFQLGTTIDRMDACRAALVDDVAAAAKEIGEAIAAVLLLNNSNASPRDALNAFAEAQQADARWDALLRRVASFLPSSTGHDAGKSGVPPT